MGYERKLSADEIAQQQMLIRSIEMNKKLDRVFLVRVATIVAMVLLIKALRSAIAAEDRNLVSLVTWGFIAIFMGIAVAYGVSVMKLGDSVEDFNHAGMCFIGAMVGIVFFYVSESFYCLYLTCAGLLTYIFKFVASMKRSIEGISKVVAVNWEILKISYIVGLSCAVVGLGGMLFIAANIVTAGIYVFSVYAVVALSVYETVLLKITALCMKSFCKGKKIDPAMEYNVAE